MASVLTIYLGAVRREVYIYTLYRVVHIDQDAVSSCHHLKNACVKWLGYHGNIFVNSLEAAQRSIHSSLHRMTFWKQEGENKNSRLLNNNSLYKLVRIPIMYWGGINLVSPSLSASGDRNVLGGNKL